MKGKEGYMSDHGIKTTTEGGVPPPTKSSHQHVIFLAIDVSKSTATMLGQGKKKITEIGISTLATSDLVLGRARGEEACIMEWAKKIRTRNFRIREWSNVQETDLVLGYRDNFKKELGNSEWISVHNAPKLIASCFGHTASPSALDGSSVDISAAKISSTGVVFPEGGEGEKCNIILVGNRVEKKISELRDIIGFDLTKLGNVITKKAIDVLDMFRALQQNPKSFTLHSLFQELDKPLQMKANPVSFPFWWFGKKKRKKRETLFPVRRDIGKAWLPASGGFRPSLNVVRQVLAQLGMRAEVPLAMASPKQFLHCLCLLLLFHFFLLLNPKALACFVIHAACQAKSFSFLFFFSCFCYE